MLVEIDLTAGLSSDGDALPQPTLAMDDGDVVMQFGDDVCLRMNYGQFYKLMEGVKAWNESIPATAQSEDLSKEHP